MSAWYARVQRFVDHDLWGGDPRLRPLQMAFVIGEGFVRDQLLMRAHSLTYISVLSIIPLLAVSLSMVGMLGLRGRVTAALYSRAAVFGNEIEQGLRQLIEGFNFGSLGAVGGAFLLVTTILVVGNVEKSFNHIWGIQRQRPWVRRIPDYLAVLLISPVVLGVALSLGTTLQSQSAVQWLVHTVPGFEVVYRSGLRQLPTVLFVFGFAFLYWFLPNTEVRGLSALLGGVVAGVLFLVTLWAYVTFSIGAAKLGAIFGGLAQFPFLLIFIYFAWAIVLLGAEVAFAHQNLDLYKREVRGKPPGPAAREAIGLALALEIAQRFGAGEGGWKEEGLAERLQVPVRTVRDVLAALESAGIAAPREQGADGSWQLGRPAERIAVGDVLDALRGTRRVELAEAHLAKAVEETFDAIEDRTREVTERETLADLLGRCAST